MTRIFVETSRALPLVDVLVTFGSGATHDPAGKEGLSRITARMLRRGADGLTAEAIEERIDLLGGELSADASISAISVHFEVLRRSLEPMVDLVATLLATPAFEAGRFEKLQREAEAELIESRDSDRSLCSRALRRSLFEGHPYGRRVSGTIASIRGLCPDDARAHYRAHLSAQNALVAVSGDIDADSAQAIVQRLLAGLPEGASVPDRTPPPVSRPARRLVIVDKPDRTQTQMAIGRVGAHPRDADFDALTVANTAFGGTFTSRLMQEVRAKRGWSYGASSNLGYDRQADAFSMWTAPAATDAAACLALELELWKTWRDAGLEAAEVDFAKRYLAASHAFDIDTAKKRVHQDLAEVLYDLPPGYARGYVERIGRVAREACDGAVRARLADEGTVVSVVGSRAELEGPLLAAMGGGECTVLPIDFE